MSAPADGELRWLTFEVGEAIFALPIRDVLEVSEAAPVGPVPSVPRRIGGVMPYHGDALPVVSSAALLDVAADPGGRPEHVVVVAGHTADTPRLGLPVDRVVGLMDAPAPPGRAEHPVAARLPIDGRITGVLDAERLCERAANLIAGGNETDFNDSEEGGET